MLKYCDGYTMYALESAWGFGGRVKGEEIASSRKLTEASETSQIGKGEKCLKSWCDTKECLRSSGEEEEQGR